MPTPASITARVKDWLHGIPVRQKFNIAASLLATALAVGVGIQFGNGWAALVIFIATLVVYAITTFKSVPGPEQVGLVFFTEQFQVNDVLKSGPHFGLVPGLFKLKL